MKKITLTLLCSLFACGIFAQTVTSLHENFDVACAVSSGSPSGWLEHNPVAGTSPQGSWMCTATDGRPTATGSPTPGMMCTSVYGSPLAFHLDTSYLITPMLYLASYVPGHVYLHFDSKVTTLIDTGELHIIKAPGGDSTFTNILDTDITSAALPLISNGGDYGNWVTHEIDLSSYETSGAFFLGFRYTGSTTAGTIWYLDNVNTSTTRLYTPNVKASRLPLTVAGQSTSSQIVINYSSPTAGQYQLMLYDMLGRVLHSEMLYARGGFEAYTISGLNLLPGMYFLRLGNETDFNVAKVMVP